MVLVLFHLKACDALQPLDDGHVGHASTFAHGLQAIA